MKGSQALDRQREVRYHRFGLALGVGVAALLHAALFLWPAPEGFLSPPREALQRGLVARAYRPSPVDPPGAPVTPDRPRPTPAAPPPSTAPQPREAAQAPEAERPEPPRPQSGSTPVGAAAASAAPPNSAGAGGPSRGKGATEIGPRAGATAQAGAGGGAGGGTAGLARAGPGFGGAGGRTEEAGARGTNSTARGGGAGGSRGGGKDEWSAVLTDLASRGKSLSGKEVAWGSGAGPSAGGQGQGGAGGGRGGRGGGKGGGDWADRYVDPRVTVVVISYPPTSLDKSPPPIAYPDVRVKKSELRAGVCRVVYRVWTDESGSVVRRELMAPEAYSDRKLYAPFIGAVTHTVDDWGFDRRKAEIHVDARFEIE